MTYVLWVEATALGEPIQLWLQSSDVDAHDGRGRATFTADPQQALQFPDFLEAMACWKQQSVVRPLRDDGRPNRPLTAYTVSPMPLDRAARWVATRES